MDEVIVEQAMFQLIDGAPSLCCQLFEPDPDQERIADVITRQDAPLIKALALPLQQSGDP